VRARQFILASLAALTAAVGLASSSTFWAQNADAAPTPSPGQIEQFTNQVDHLRSATVSVLIGVVTLLALLLVPYLFFRIVQARRARQLVVEDFKNASGIADVKDLTAGLSELGREALLRQLDKVRVRVRETISKARFLSEALIPEPLPPRASPDQTLANLTGSISGILSKESGPYVGIITSTILKPKGTKVTPSLQRRGPYNRELGITFSIADLQDEEAPDEFTLWEGNDEERKNHSLECWEPTPSSALSPPPTEAGVANGNAPAAEERYGNLLPPAMRLLAVSLFRTELRRDQNRRMWARVSPFDALRRGVRTAVRERRQNNEGLIHNYAGILLQGPAQNWPSYAGEFYNRAAEEFEAAIRLVPTYFQTYENLADTLALLAKVRGLDSSRGIRNVHASLVNYDLAIQVLDIARKRWKITREEFESSKLRLQVNRGNAALLIADMASDDAAGALDIPVLLKQWSARDEVDARLLVSYASWCGRAVSWRRVQAKRISGETDTAEQTDAKRLLDMALEESELLDKGRRALVFAVGRDYQGLHTWRPEEDCDLKPLLERLNVAALRHAIDKQRVREPCLHQTSGQEFEEKMREVCAAAGWPTL